MKLHTANLASLPFAKTVWRCCEWPSNAGWREIVSNLTHPAGVPVWVKKHLRRHAQYRSGHRDWRKVKTVAWREANRERWRLFERFSVVATCGWHNSSLLVGEYFVRFRTEQTAQARAFASASPGRGICIR